MKKFQQSITDSMDFALKIKIAFEEPVKFSFSQFPFKKKLFTYYVDIETCMEGY